MDGVRRGGALLEVFVKDTARSCLDKCAASFEEAQERQEQRNEEKAEIKARNAKQQVCMLLPYGSCGSSHGPLKNCSLTHANCPMLDP